GHWPLVREPTDVLWYPEFAQWCGTTLTAAPTRSLLLSDGRTLVRARRPRKLTQYRDPRLGGIDAGRGRP
ncbi:hypothetical protein, partial [Streptomyces sp. NPDC001274]